MKEYTKQNCLRYFMQESLNNRFSIVVYFLGSLLFEGRSHLSFRCHHLASGFESNAQAGVYTHDGARNREEEEEDEEEEKEEERKTGREREMCKTRITRERKW